MSTRVSLTFVESPHNKLRRFGIGARVIRLVTRVAFRQGNGWSADRPAIVDTGAPLAVLPLTAWRAIETKILVHGQEISVAGLTVIADVGEVSLKIRDVANASPELTVRAFLCFSDHVPMLLGMEDFLTRCSLFTDYASKTSYVEFP